MKPENIKIHPNIYISNTHKIQQYNIKIITKFAQKLEKQGEFV